MNNATLKKTNELEVYLNNTEYVSITIHIPDKFEVANIKQYKQITSSTSDKTTEKKINNTLG